MADRRPARPHRRAATDVARTRRLVTPEGVPLNITLGTAGARAGAFFLDLIVMLFVLIVFTVIALLTGLNAMTGAGGIVLAIWMIGAFVLRNFYFILFESGRRAATPGKRLMKLRVVSRDGGRLTSGAVIARNMMREIELFLALGAIPAAHVEGFSSGWAALFGFGWTLIFLFFPLFNRDRMRAGDLIAGTWVVEAERRKIGAELLDRRPAGTAIAPFTPAELAVYGQYELQRLEDLLRQGDADALTTVAATIRRKIGRPDDRQDRAFLDAYYAALRQELERKLLFGKRKADKFDAAN
ncbi:RDD family protein [Sphingomonas sp. FW199]|uniref:RDD family protein n=1 Tax=Sphingomonas sp. FW199 TaxID=3400217 RepID=UPI003CF31F26